KFAEKGTLTEKPDSIRARLKGTTNKQELADCDIIIEAIVENVEEKKKMYESIDGIAKKDTIFATNTSSISVTELLSATNRPDRFIGLHFFNPVPLMKLVEVVRTIATANDVYDTAIEFAKKLGKVPVRTSDRTGFIVNRLLVPYLLDAIRAYEEGVGSIPDIDNAMKLGCGYPMGPFTLLDFVGLDTTYYITQVMYEEFKERRFASPPLLKRLVMAGWYDRKTGKGFYDYADPAAAVWRLEIAAGTIAAFASVALVGAYGMWRDRLWGWWLAFLADGIFAGVLMYCVADDGWNNADPELIVSTALFLVPVILLLLPPVRRFYWETSRLQPPAAAGEPSV